ncbi:MAG: polysaccharide pyruvyl transferase CsaB [Prochloron sp. SP5CPC1]|nr:polysaccharide pyruvyl transferase CsaB [Candidatus Paraprochloron terpiosi SP5CPC1]
MKTIKAVICGYYGKGNGGDEALLMSLLQMLPKQVTPIVLSADPRQTSQRYGVQSCHNRSAVSILRALSQSDCFIWGGGSLMQDVTSLASPFYYGGLMALAQQFGMKTIAWAQGIGPLDHPLTRGLTKWVLRRCNAVSVRDNGSAKLLADWGITPTIAPDPVWALEGKEISRLSDLPTPRIAVILRGPPHLTPQGLENLTLALIQLQKATDACILLVPFQPVLDQDIADLIAQQLPGSVEVISLENPQELKGLFRGVKMAIAMRYHGLVMAAAAGCTCFAISYDPKVKQLMTELNLPGWELEKLPDKPDLMSQIWLEHYLNGRLLNLGIIQSLISSALIHQKVLYSIIG